MKKIVTPILSIFALLFVMSLAGCTSDYQSADYARICVDEKTHERVDGDRCGTNDSIASNGFLWWYILYGRTIPPYGGYVSGGYQTVSKNSIIEHDERIAPKGGKTYTKATTRSYSNGSGKKLGTTSGGTGYKAPAPKAPAPQAPKVNNAPKAPAPKFNPPAPRPIAPAPRPPAPVRIK